MPYSDGTYTSAVQNGPKRVFYPFLNSPTKDTTTKGTVRNYVVLPGSFTPASALSTDPDDSTQYLIEESDLQIDAGLALFSRTYCKVPGTQTVPTSVIVSKPQIPGDDAFPKVISSYLVTQPDATVPRYDAYLRQTVTSDSGAGSFYPTGGTYTLTFGGNTTGALHYNDNAATVEAALDALTSVSNRGGCTVTGSYNSSGGFTVTFASYAQITIASGSLTGTGTLTEIETLTNGGYSQSVGAYFAPTSYTLSVNQNSLSWPERAVNSLSVTNQGSYAQISGPTYYTFDLSFSGGGGSGASGYAVIYSIGGGNYAIYGVNLTSSGSGYTSAPTVSVVVPSDFTVNTAAVVAASLQNAYSTISSPTSTSKTVDIYSNAGSFSSGTFTVTVNGSTTSAINYNASSLEIAEQINALGVGTYNVNRNAVGLASIYFTITAQNSEPTGGTFTITVGANTTGSLNYNDSASTVSTALNALTSVTNRGGCTVTGSLASGFAISFANSAITASASSLTPAGSTINPTISDGTIGRTQTVAFSSPSAIRTLYCANHGITTSDTLFLYNGTTYFSGIISVNFTIPDVNTIRLNGDASSVVAISGTISRVGKRTKANYQPGSVAVKGSEITNFYLPGVTSGITTAADIPIPNSAANDIDLLLAIFSGSTTINTNVGRIQQWRGPILSLTYEQVSAANV